MHKRMNGGAAVYKTALGRMDTLASVMNKTLTKSAADGWQEEKLLLKGGLVIDPANGVAEEKDLRVRGGVISETGKNLAAEDDEAILNCEGLMVWPGLIDMHLHMGDLFEVTTNSIFCAAEGGVTLGLSPGAGNTFMAPALLGAEVDRGVPMNLGVYLGGANVLATRLLQDELVDMFRGELDFETISRKMTRNPITNTTAALTVGIKDHMGHFIMPDESIERLFDLTARANLLYMSHTQDPEHAERMARLSRGRPLHLAHATAAGCGSHGEALDAMQRVLALVDGKTITAEFVTSMLRPGLGRREGARMEPAAQELAYAALGDGKVKILVSDGQSQATMKGFGDTQDNVPAILELAELGVLDLKQAVSLMTSEPAKLLAARTENAWWREKMGHLGLDALANITVVDPAQKRCVYTIVNGTITAFEGRLVRRGNGAGGWVSKFGMLKRTGVGDLAMYWNGTD